LVLDSENSMVARGELGVWGGMALGVKEIEVENSWEREIGDGSVGGAVSDAVVADCGSVLTPAAAAPSECSWLTQGWDSSGRSWRFHGLGVSGHFGLDDWATGGAAGALPGQVRERCGKLGWRDV
jgi:hypothetical protein